MTESSFQWLWLLWLPLCAPDLTKRSRAACPHGTPHVETESTSQNAAILGEATVAWSLPWGWEPRCP